MDFQNVISSVNLLTADQLYSGAMLVVGQLSFLLAALSFVKKDMLELRRLQVASGVLGIAFNGYLAFGQGELSWSLVTVVAWLSVFLILNFAAERKLSAARTEVALGADEKTLFATALPLARTNDIKKMIEAADVLVLEDEVKLIGFGEQTDYLCMVKEGNLVEAMPNGEKWLMGRGMMLGDLSYLINDACRGSGSTIFSQGQVRILKWPYSKLKELCVDSESLANALTDGIARGVAKKRNLLGASQSLAGQFMYQEPYFKQHEIDMHAESFPHLRHSGFALLLSLARKIVFKAASEVHFADGLGCIASGKLSFQNKNGVIITLERFSLIGEFGFVAPDRRGGESPMMVASEETQILVWDSEVLADLELNAPQVYLHVIQSISRSIVIKFDRSSFA